MMAKAAGSNADMVFLDLEDAVAPKAKVEARAKAVEALKNLDWGGKTRCVRINDLGTEWAFEDIITVVEGAHQYIDVIMIPKVMRGSDVLFVDTLLSQLEEIARSSPRLEALIYGVGDFSASQGIDLGTVYGPNGYPGDIWHYGRHKITIAARAAGIDAVDGPFGNFKDTATYSEECRRAKLIGMIGKWAIHPAQIELAIKAFSPSQGDVDAARAMTKAYREAEAQGLGAVVYNGEMIDAATIRLVKNVIDKADLIGM
jgi:citrate lyase subunit beta/citryl-CoA lyase